MSENELLAAQQEVLAAMARLRVAEQQACGQELIDTMTFHRHLQRQSQHDLLRIIGQCDREGEFATRNMYPGPAVADILHCPRREANLLVRLAKRVFPTTLGGELVAPVLPATAAALGSWTIDHTHVQVIDSALASAAARRLAPQQWTDAERTLAGWAALYTPEQLRDLARGLIEQLDQDGAEPTDDDVDADNQINELHLTPDSTHHGGRIKGQLDSPTFDALTQILDSLRDTATDDGKTLAERNADALGMLCDRTLDDGELPEQGGEKPHLTLILRHDELKRGRRGGSLTATGCRIGPKEIRRIACESAIIPLLLSGKSRPLDVKREQRTATRYQRRVLAARDGGCAYPGCDRSPRWCSAHHISHWADGGETKLDNLVLLCRTHHRMIHTSGWTVRIRDGFPEFTPPKWLDHRQTPRRKPSAHCY
jgi:Domain of unknown function (DUF222)/HNH endonuclease